MAGGATGEEDGADFGFEEIVRLGGLRESMRGEGEEEDGGAEEHTDIVSRIGNEGVEALEAYTLRRRSTATLANPAPIRTKLTGSGTSVGFTRGLTVKVLV